MSAFFLYLSPQMKCYVISQKESNVATTGRWFLPNPEQGLWVYIRSDLFMPAKCPMNITETKLERERDNEQCLGLATILD